MTEAMHIAVEDVRTNGGTQSRAAINDDVVSDYADAIGDGVEFPRIKVFFDGTDYWLADGFHRLAAYAKSGRAKIPAEIEQGTRREAILYSVGANSNHGLRRTNDDKRRAVMTLLNDPEWSKWTAREIARQCGVSADFAARLKREVSSDDSEPRTYTTKHGTEAQMNTTAIGKPKTVGNAQAADDEKPAATAAEADRQPDQVEKPAEEEERQPEAADPQPEPEPDPNAKLRAEFRKLSDEGQEEDWIGLRVENDELRARVRKQTGIIADLKAKIKSFEGDQAEAIRRLTKDVTNAGNAKWKAEEELNSWKRQVHKLKARVSELERMEIPLN